MGEDFTGIDRRKKRLVAYIDQKGIQARRDGHIEKSSVDQSPSGESHAHVAEAANDMGIGVG